MVTTPASTTLSANLTLIAGGVAKIPLTAIPTGAAVGGVLVIGREVLPIKAIDSTALTATCLRGRDGSAALRYASGTPVYYFPATGGWTRDLDNRRIGVAGYEGYLTSPFLPIGSEWQDPATGYVYKLVDCGASFILGEWVVIDADGLATQLAIGSKGFVGINTDLAVSSDQLAWALVVGKYASALFDSDVTTAMQLGAAAGFAAPFDSTNHTLIERASCIVAPSTATSPTVGDGLGTALIYRPFVSGVATFVS